MIILILVLCASLFVIFKQHKEIKRLHECWDDVFNAKLDGERKWYNLCNHYLDRITELQTEIEILKTKRNKK